MRPEFDGIMAARVARVAEPRKPGVSGRVRRARELRNNSAHGAFGRRSEGRRMMVAAAAPPVRILTFTTLYPNAAQPVHGVMVENRLRHLLATGQVAASVIAPVPWFPSQSDRFGPYATFAKAPTNETRHGVRIRHPRYLVIPKVGAGVAPLLLAAGAYAAIARQAASFDVIDAHYFYPDGVAAVLIARRLGKPVVITARGSDINVLPRTAVPRRWIRWAAQQANAIITVSAALRDALLALDVGRPRIEVLRNGVDLAQFSPLAPAAARAQLGLGAGRIVLSVGKLVEAKGHDLVIRAIAGISDTRLVIVGEGPYRAELERLAVELGVADRVSLRGELPHADLRSYYCAADVLVLASAREGMPNVVLESLACGTPTVATDVGGIGEVLPADAGVLLRERTPAAVRTALESVLRETPSREAIRRHAERLDWGPVVRDQIALYRDVVGSGEQSMTRRQA
jgi:teichuronic acid biosynthesis glycosyltransferase TuaC